MNAIHFADNLRCELLSEFSTFGISNNIARSISRYIHVVNCFQNLVPLVSATTFINLIRL